MNNFKADATVWLSTLCLKEDKATYVVKPMFNSDYAEQYRNLIGAN